MFVFLLQFIMRYIDQLVGKGLGGWLIAELIVLNLAWMLVLAVPMSVLVATLMAYGNLSSSNEITTMKASGMSVYRMIAPSFLVGGLLALFLVYFNNEILPDANHHAKSLIIDIRRKKPTLTIEAGKFSNDISGYSILARKTFEQSNELEGVTIYDYTNPDTDILVTAKKGNVSFSRDFENLIMDLTDGEIHELDVTDYHAYRTIRFNHHRIVMNVEGFMFQRSSEGTFERGDRELSAPVMQLRVDSLKILIKEIRNSIGEKMKTHFTNLLEGNFGSTQRSQQRQFTPYTQQLDNFRFFSALVYNDIARLEYYENEADEFLVEIHKKYSIPVACIVFVLVGAPLGMMVRRGGFGIAATLSLGFFLLYWSFLVGGEKLADRDIISPFWGMWSANILLALLGVYLVRRSIQHSSAMDYFWKKRFAKMIDEIHTTPNE